MAKLSLPSGYQRVPATAHMTEEGAAHLKAVFMAQSGRPFVTEDGYRNFMTAPFVSLDNDVVMVRDNDDNLVAQALVINRPPFVDPTCFGAVSPDHCGNGLGSALIAWERERAEERLAETPDGTRVLLQAFSDPAHEPSVALLEDNGFTANRFFLTMAIEFDDAPEAAQFPDDLDLRAFTPD